MCVSSQLSRASGVESGVYCIGIITTTTILLLLPPATNTTGFHYFCLSWRRSCGVAAGGRAGCVGILEAARREREAGLREVA